MWGALAGALIQIVGTLVGKVLISLGVGYVTYSGVQASLTYVKGQALGSLTSIGGVAVQLMGVLNLDQALNLIFSALLMRLTFDGLSTATGAMKSMRLK